MGGHLILKLIFSEATNTEKALVYINQLLSYYSEKDAKFSPHFQQTDRAHLFFTQCTSYNWCELTPTIL